MDSDPTTPIAKIVRQLLNKKADGDEIVRAVEAAEIGAAKGSSLATGSRGTRIPADWQPSENLISYGERLGLSRSRIQLETEKFKNYWTAKAGAGAVKRDWSATWRNWILTAMESRHAPSRARFRAGGAPAVAGRTKTGADAVLAGMGRLANRLAERGNSAGPEHGKMGDDPHVARNFDVESEPT